MAGVTFDFTGEHVLVTGASSGIGEAVATGFAEAGASLTILAENERIHEAAERISAIAANPVVPIVCDVTQPEAVAEALAAIGPCDVLVNNAGIERMTPVLDATAQSDADFRRILEINVVGTYSVTKAIAGRMPQGGRIIMTSSIWGRVAVPEFSAYCASKHALIGFTRSIAHELAPRSIRVNAVCPGWVRTAQSMASLHYMAEREGRRENDVLDDITGAQLFPVLLEPHDVVGVYLFLASPAAANMTGQAVVVDRGEVMA